MQALEFETLLSACSEVAGLFPDGVVFIDGIAVYLHTKNIEATSALAEFTHDADFYISLADMADLRDIEDVTPNRRLSKHQMIKKGFEFDIYTERQSSLIVPYDAIAANAESISEMKIASLEHLLVLKLEAYADHRASTKGDKDAKDILRIAQAASRGPIDFRGFIAAPYIRDEHMSLLQVVARGPYATALARGNAVLAKRIREDLQLVIKSINDEFAEPSSSIKNSKDKRPT